MAQAAKLILSKQNEDLFKITTSKKTIAIPKYFRIRLFYSVSPPSLVMWWRDKELEAGVAAGDDPEDIDKWMRGIIEMTSAITTAKSIEISDQLAYYMGRDILHTKGEKARITFNFGIMTTKRTVQIEFS